MLDLNRVELIGRLGKDPEVLKETDTGCFVRLSIATNRKYKNAKGEEQNDSQWHTVFLSNQLGKKAKAHFKKGQQLWILGELRTSEWTDDKGSAQKSLAIHAKAANAFAQFSNDSKRKSA